MNITLAGKDPNNDSLSFFLVKKPSLGNTSKIRSLNKTSSMVTYTPNPHSYGQDVLTFKANDGNLNSTNTASVIMKLKPWKLPSHRPVAVDQYLDSINDTAIKITLKGSDKDRDRLTAINITKPLHGTLSNFNQKNGTIIYTPVRNYIGRDSFTFRVSDGSCKGANVATVHIKISPLTKGIPYRISLLNHNVTSMTASNATYKVNFGNNFRILKIEKQSNDNFDKLT